MTAGKRVYTSLCIACHRKTAGDRRRWRPSLAGSTFALGRAGDPVRILLQWKGRGASA